jgi:malonate-semialdehyde dehydrogenase (acetylating)/methylmalonate-semialdehyde dehydrogenase
MPDADIKKTVDAIITASAFGAAGDRCLAGSVLVAVGHAQPLLDALLGVRRLRMDDGSDASTEMDP